MVPIEFAEQTIVLAPPVGFNEREPVKCGGLPIQRTVTPEGVPVMYSHWKPSPEELASLNAGGFVQLSVFGTGHPPVWVATSKAQADVDRKPKVEFD